MTDDVLTAIRREVVDAELREKTVVQIRVTAHAIPGSIVCLPVTRPDGCRPYEPLLEVLVHPDDWREFLITLTWGNVHLSTDSDDVLYVLGLPVARGLGA